MIRYLQVFGASAKHNMRPGRCLIAKPEYPKNFRVSMLFLLTSSYKMQYSSYVKKQQSLLDKAKSARPTREVEGLRERCELALAYINGTITSNQVQAAIIGVRGAYYGKLGTAILTGARRGILKIEMVPNEK